EAHGVHLRHRDRHDRSDRPPDVRRARHIEAVVRWQRVRHRGARHDAANRATGTTVTIPAAETGLAGSYTIGLTYNPDNTVATTTLPAAGGLPAETLTTAYTSAGLPLALSGAVDYVSATTYLETGQVTSLTDNTTVAYQQFNYD